MRRPSTEALRAYSMVIALIAIWIFFQVKTVSDVYPFGLFQENLIQGAHERLREFRIG